MATGTQKPRRPKREALGTRIFPTSRERLDMICERAFEGHIGRALEAIIAAFPLPPKKKESS